MEEAGLGYYTSWKKLCLGYLLRLKMSANIDLHTIATYESSKQSVNRFSFIY